MVPVSFQVLTMKTRSLILFLNFTQTPAQPSSFEILLAGVSEPPTQIPAAASCRVSLPGLSSPSDLSRIPDKVNPDATVLSSFRWNAAQVQIPTTLLSSSVTRAKYLTFQRSSLLIYSISLILPAPPCWVRTN